MWLLWIVGSALAEEHVDVASDDGCIPYGDLLLGGDVGEFVSFADVQPVTLNDVPLVDLVPTLPRGVPALAPLVSGVTRAQTFDAQPLRWMVDGTWHMSVQESLATMYRPVLPTR